MKRFVTISLVGICIVVFLTIAYECAAAEWGSLKGRFIVDGKPPENPPNPVDDKDPFCQKAMPKSEWLTVSDKNELANVVVYLRVPRGKKLTDIHPDYAAQLSEPVTIDNHGCSFVPHVSIARVGQTLQIKRSDPTGHNTNIQFLGFNQTIPPEGNTLKISKESGVPAPIVCNIHAYMKGFMLALEHPYMAVTGKDGSFEIKNIPAGKHEFQFWHEPRYFKEVKFKGGKTSALGRAMLTIAPDQMLDLGDIKVPAGMLKPN